MSSKTYIVPKVGGKDKVHFIIDKDNNPTMYLNGVEVETCIEYGYDREVYDYGSGGDPFSRYRMQGPMKLTITLYNPEIHSIQL